MRVLPAEPVKPVTCPFGPMRVPASTCGAPGAERSACQSISNQTSRWCFRCWLWWKSRDIFLWVFGQATQDAASEVNCCCCVRGSCASISSPTFLERGRRKAPPVPVYGSPKQVITIRKLPVRRDDIQKISFSLDFTAADGRRPVTFEIPTGGRSISLSGLGGISCCPRFERNRRKIHEVAATIYFRGRRTTIVADDFNTA